MIKFMRVQWGVQIPIRLISTSLISLGLAACGAGSGDGLNEAGQPLSDSDLVETDDLFTSVQSIFTANCIRCHAGASAPQGMSLAEGVSYNQIVSVASNQQSDLLRVDPGNPDASYLLQKVMGTPGISGAQMPLGGPFLNSDDIQTITDWISLGAQPASSAPITDEFVAEINVFSNYRNWQSIDYTVGRTNQFLTDGIHSSNQNDFFRRVYANEIALNSTGDEYEIGSILVKETFTYANENLAFEFAGEGGLLAMVKRGGDYSPNGGGWEWFNLQTDLSEVNARGIDVRMGTCLSCHTAAEFDEEGHILGGNDYVFEHTSEVIATDETFSNYQEWPVIDTLTTRPESLGERAHGASIEASTRIVYKKQLYANPDSTDQGYPIGTVLVKEALDAENAIIDVTAMVKRGGGFSPLFGDWEWFLLEEQTGNILVDESGEERRGAQLNNGGCVGCHSDATTEKNSGIDFVFKHEDDPFNNNDEFVAELSDFSGFESWMLVDYTIGAANPLIAGGAHRGNADNFVRKVYANSNAQEFDGALYPRGSIFVKTVTTFEGESETFAEADGLLAMAKRGGTFGQESGGWEYFGLETDLSGIIKRGADVNNGGCNSCHLAANTESPGSGIDFIFPTPTEIVPTNADFENYTSWLLVDERSDRNPQLGPNAHNAATDGSVRKVYKKQAYAYPLENSPGYPVGTTYVKEIFAADGTTLVGLVAMVKVNETAQEEGSNTVQSGWEYFVLEASTGEILINEDGSERRGMSLSGDGSMTNGCVGCHSAANLVGEGSKDFIFDHPNDPFVSASSN